jgi:lipopolysaccharide transport system permease protein
MAKREVVGRYRGSILGLLWSFFQPLFMLAIYTFVFSMVFKAKWGATHSDSKTEFALILFAGLIVFNLFADVVNRSPDIIVANVNFVKKVVFPLELLPVIASCSALFHAFVSTGVLLTFNGIINHTFSFTVFILPIIFIPLTILILAFAWFLSSLGVYLRDVGQTVTLLTTALLFLSPIFFPPTALPEQIRPYLHLNPLTFIIEQSRKVLIWGQMPDWQGLCLYTLFATALAWLGYLWFQKTRKGFADVL